MASTRIPDAIKRIFTDTFTARDVAEPLASFDAGVASEIVRDCMNNRAFEVVGIRREGQIVGFAEKASLGNGICGQSQRPLREAIVLSENAPLLTVLMELNRAPFVFITMLGAVGGIITRDDMQKPPVRMWLFGIVTLVEMRFSELIQKHCSVDGWKKYLSEARLQKAHVLLEERRRRNQALQLFDCLQFSDKGQIVARNDELRKWTIFASRSQAEDATKRLERLRNNLAHAQDILSGDWEAIVQICEFLAQH